MTFLNTLINVSFSSDKNPQNRPRKQHKGLSSDTRLHVLKMKSEPHRLEIRIFFFLFVMFFVTKPFSYLHFLLLSAYRDNVF